MDYDIVRSGFRYSHGGLTTDNGVPRVPASSLRKWFIPTPTTIARKTMKKQPGFILAQLHQYDIELNEFPGDEICQLTMALEAGRCDEVPKHLVTLHEQMHADYVDNLDLERLFKNPQWTMERFFLSYGKPDRTKTTTVVEIPAKDRNSALEMWRAASKISGLCHELFHGLENIVFLGWNVDVVKKAAKKHAAKEAGVVRIAQDARQKKRDDMHAAYLHTLKEKVGAEGDNGQWTCLPTGSYIVDCHEIEDSWPDETQDMTLNVDRRGAAGRHHANFHFGYIEGKMEIWPKPKKTERTANKIGRESEAITSHSTQAEANTENGESSGAGTKRSATSALEEGQNPNIAAKRPKPAGAADPPLVYGLWHEGNETGEGETYESCTGKLTFADGMMASFTAVADFPWLGEDILFTARKISDTPVYR